VQSGQANLKRYERLQRQQLEQQNTTNSDGTSSCENEDATVEKSVLEDAGSSGTRCTPNNRVIHMEKSCTIFGQLAL